jgi:hypothetical protein
VAIRIAGSPNHHDHSAIEKSDRLEPRFAIVEPIVGFRVCTPSEDFRSFKKIEAPLLQRGVALSRIEGDFHSI